MELVVDLKTDMVNGVEFVRVETELVAAKPIKIDSFADRSGNYLLGRRVAEFPRVEPGVQQVVVRLFDRDACGIISRHAVISVEQRTAPPVRTSGR